MRPHPFFPERVIKSAEEVAAIELAQRHTETALAAAVDVLRESVIRGDQVMWKERPLTSEDLKKVVNVSLMENDCIAQHTIIACGEQGVDPHNQGSGPIRPNKALIFDICPRRLRRLLADMKRTVSRARRPTIAPNQDAVLAAQLSGIEMVRPRPRRASRRVDARWRLAATRPASWTDAPGGLHGRGTVSASTSMSRRNQPIDTSSRRGRWTVEPGL